MARPDELTFAPLGGVGEIGMNLSIYGLGNRHQRSWLAVDLGVSFGDEEHLPGIDLIMPDIRFLEKERKNLIGLVLTHAHEDHFGAIIDLWPKLKCPIYATPFSAALFEAKCASERNPPKIPVTVVPSAAASISGRSHRVHSGRAFDSGIACAGDPHRRRHRAAHRRLEDRSDADHRPPTDERRCASSATPACWRWSAIPPMRCAKGARRRSRSRKDHHRAGRRRAKGRVAVTTFASNVARMRAVADAAKAAGREVVVVGRAMERVVQVARETGYLDGVQNFRGADLYGHFPPDKVLALCTGSQGEPRAALARIANDDHPQVTLNKGDCVIFSSRTIPGNEKAVGAIINGLIDAGRRGHHRPHPSRPCLRPSAPRRAARHDLLGAPQLLIPVHGEALHLSEHAKLARAAGVPKV
jgi:ribonuclease J